MKKILFLITCMSIGGAERVLIDLVNNLDRNKYDITVMMVYKNNIYNQGNCNFDGYFRKDIKVKYMCNNALKIVYRLFNISLNRLNNEIIHKIFIGNKYDIEIAFSEGLPTKIISSSTNKTSKKMAWLHTDSINRTRNMEYSLLNKEKAMYSKFNKLIAVSNSVAKSFIKLHGNIKDIEVKYNTIDTIKIYNKAKEEVYFNFGTNINFIAIGRLIEVKGYERLIEVAKRLKDDNFKFNLIILGDGELRDKLEKMIKYYNLSETVYLLGLQENPYKYLSRCDLFVCSSFVEGLSTVVLEAINLNIPVVTTDCNGMDEIFGNSKCGIICENSDNGLYDALKSILINPKLINEYRNECKVRSSRFRVDKIIKEIENII